MTVLDVGRRGISKKDELVDKLCDWCLRPEKWIKKTKTFKNEKVQKAEKRKPDTNQNTETNK